MKTDDLIKAMVADNATVSPPISRTVGLAVSAGLVMAALLFFVLLKVRSDFFYAILHEPRFMFKFVFTIGLGLPALLLVRRLSRPDGDAGGLVLALMIPVMLLIAAVVAEMNALPADHWSVSALGSMPGACMKYIPMLSFAPLLAILWALRNGAPANPVGVGAAAGLLAAAIGATFYATFCVDDSPMFLAIWYVGGMAIVTALGAIIGARLLRW
jgi:hypothetical protein